ncbi:pyridoxamine 5'-phosphate oxidase family protein [Fusobacterium sp.]|uniref:pyridoxamine 5'-phosphate oxidase family protein n=1 Tax=Fusobacterium sp. TaxID=68766 RepID=UPI002901CFC5|nr:pyridoxamine 5'-phosphate oxidase family protein [Fusobacterium sp.]MDU1909778.1 pyridoxamine 5'-phosphate oxidase family protein [Fusobacterium sp.]
MDLLKEFYEIMEKQSDIALATSVNDIPNVRIVSFYFWPDKNILYFSSFKDEVKTKEFEKNNKVSFTTIPRENIKYARTNSGIVKKSDLPMSDFKQVVCEKVPDYKEIIDNFEDKLIIYEISFKEATITINYDEHKITL